jgi:crotonobetainyl-CoA:carnitine CoA-transferase CaiB-like acyl-CoA transferase
MVGCGNDGQFKDFCQRLNLNELPNDSKFNHNDVRVQHRDELVMIINRKMESRTNEEWNVVLEGAKFPYGPVNNLKQVFSDPQVQHNQMVRSMMHDSLGQQIKQVFLPASEALRVYFLLCCSSSSSCCSCCCCSCSCC